MAILNLQKPYVLRVFQLLALLVTKIEGNKIFLITFFSLFIAQISSANILNKLKEKFPGCDIRTKSYFLTKADISLLKEKYPDRSVEKFYSYYKKRCLKESSNIFIFNDLVRTHRQIVLFEIKEGKLKIVEVLKFSEPREYLAPMNWYKDFEGKSIKDVQDIDSISGATLTVNSTKYLSYLSLYLREKIN